VAGFEELLASVMIPHWHFPGRTIYTLWFIVVDVFSKQGMEKLSSL